MVTVTGGKLTTYRLMAEQTVDAAVKVLSMPVAKSRTRHLKLIGAPANSGRGRMLPISPDLADLGGTRVADHFGLEPDSMTALVRRHGTEAPASVWNWLPGRPDLLQPLVEGLPYLKVEAIWAARHEMSLTVDDLLSRRTRSVLRRAEAAAAAAGGIAAMLATELGQGRRRHAAERLGRSLKRVISRPGSRGTAQMPALSRRGCRAHRAQGDASRRPSPLSTPNRRPSPIVSQARGSPSTKRCSDACATAAQMCRSTDEDLVRSRHATGGRSPSGGRRGVRYRTGPAPSHVPPRRKRLPRCWRAATTRVSRCRRRVVARACAARACPSFGGVALDMTGVEGVVDIDTTSLRRRRARRGPSVPSSNTSCGLRA